MTLMNPPRRPSMAEIQGIARHFRTTQGLVHSTWTPYLGIKEDGDATAAGHSHSHSHSHPHSHPH